MRETAQRQADGASKAKHRIQPVVCAVGWRVRLQNSALVKFSAAAGALSVFVRHRRCGASVGLACEALLSSSGAGVLRLTLTRSHHNRSCQRVPAYALGQWAPGGWLFGDVELARPVRTCWNPAGYFNVAHC